MASNAQPLPLLELPDPCLLAVLRCCAADDVSTLFSAARAHSRLQQAAVVALSSITIQDAKQHSLDSLLLYLAKHGQRVRSIDLEGQLKPRPVDRPTLWQLSYSTLQQLTSLSLSRLRVQLQPLCVFGGVLQAGAPLKQLQLSGCILLDGDRALAAAVSQLPALEHLSLSGFDPHDPECFQEVLEYPGEALQALIPAQVTHLELLQCELPDTVRGTGLQHMQRLTRLLDLRLEAADSWSTITASMLSDLQQLTRLDLQADSNGRLHVEPGVLAGRTQLQHLLLAHCSMASDPAGMAVLLSHIQSLQQLTFLDVACSMLEAIADPAAYSALTASSRLRYLNVAHNNLPASVWQHLFPTNCRLPQLQELRISIPDPDTNQGAVVFEGSRLVSCCPSLQELYVHCRQYGVELLGPLSMLSGLHDLCLGYDTILSAQQFHAVLQLSALRCLRVPEVGDPPLLAQLSRLQHLTYLSYHPSHLDWDDMDVTFTSEAPGDEPVWRQVLQYAIPQSYHSDPAVAQQAAAALAE